MIVFCFALLLKIAGDSNVLCKAALKKKKGCGKRTKTSQASAESIQCCCTMANTLLIKSLLFPRDERNFCDDEAWERAAWCGATDKQRGEMGGHMESDPGGRKLCSSELCVCWQRCLLVCESADSPLWSECATVSLLPLSSMSERADWGCHFRLSAQSLFHNLNKS